MPATSGAESVARQPQPDMVPLLVTQMPATPTEPVPGSLNTYEALSLTRQLAIRPSLRRQRGEKEVVASAHEWEPRTTTFWTVPLAVIDSKRGMSVLFSIPGLLFWLAA